jgi:hypothetical protein
MTAIQGMAAVISQIVQTIANLMIQIEVEAALAAVRAGGAAAMVPFIGPILAISAAAAIFSAMMAYIPGRQNGGPVGANSPYIVGEVGPELFIPSSAGTIVPNDKLGGGVTNIQITAMDAKSFHQFLRGNTGALVSTLREASANGRI